MDSYEIPIDLFVSKKNPRHRIITTSNGFSLRFTDSCSDLVFSVDPIPSTKHHHLLADSSGETPYSIAHNQKAIWHGYKKESSDEKDLMFRVERTTNTLSRLEFQVYLNLTDGDGNPNKSDFKMRGSPFFRSCTIYKGDSIVAQTSLMYKLGMQKVIVPRNKFRLTIFPGGYVDHAFIVAFIAIFFDGRKLWI
ncbi:hypothetical protein OSB04_un001864 [Centaurea solstitialis]|uniref:Uncharacterized protein n=1 Tax=Centaurea solstitialis TaxID=347529 RepID=A0AA38S1D3_9ASTR|nr:hypothetical protein OSB04_un001864 [Centaurea solstitialis]